MKINLLQQKDLEPLIEIDPNQEIYLTNRYYKTIQKIPYLKRLKIVLDLMGNKKYDNFLEIGFGSGIFLPELADRSKKLTATDIHQYMNDVKEVIESKNIKADLIKADVCDMPFEDNSFDGIVCLSVLEFVPNTLKAIQEIKRVAKPNSKIIIGIPVINFITDICYDIIKRKKYSDISHKSDHKKIIKYIKNNLQLKKIKTYPVFMPINLSLFIVLEATKKYE